MRSLIILATKKTHTAKALYLIIAALFVTLFTTIISVTDAHASFIEYYDNDSFYGAMWYKTDLCPGLETAYGLFSNLHAKEAPDSIAGHNNATYTINAGVWYTDGSLNGQARGPVGIGDTIVCADYCEGNDTLVFKSDGSLDNELIDSYSNYITKRNEGVQWAVKGKAVLIDEGTIESSFPDATERAPRTFIAQDYDGYYYIGVTGTDDGVHDRTGPTYQELADFVYSLATNMKFAYALDGGGSSALLDGTDRLNTDIQHVDRAVSNCICFYATGWLKKNNNWYYYDSDHALKKGWLDINDKRYYLRPSDEKMYSNEWLEYNGNWYYFVNSGAMATGWLELDDGWHYFGTDGHGTAGWRQINDKWYYFSNSGVMYESEWLYYNGNWYYFKDNGAMATGWLQLGNYWYYLGTDGKAATGQRYINNKWYCFYDNCKMYCNEWLESNGNWYYYGPSGAKLFGWQKIDEKWHYFNSETGAGVTGFNNLVWNGQLHLYHFNSSGVMTTNSWIQSGNNWLYFTGSGAAAVGLTTINGYEYYFNSSGIMQTGWILVNGEYMYFDPNTGRHIPDGTW